MSARSTKSGACPLYPGAQFAPTTSLLTLPDRTDSLSGPGPFSGEVEDDGEVTIWASSSLADKSRRCLRRAFE